MVQEVTTTSWFKRIGNAFVGIFIGLILICVSFYFIFWNEHHSLHMAQSLKQAQQVLVSVPESPVSSANNNKVVYFSGMTTVADTIQDSLFGLSGKYIRLNRKVEMYQWQENEESKTESHAGGSETTTTTYTYAPVWSEELIDSNKFKESETHKNPQRMVIPPQIHQAQHIKVGDYVLPSSLIDDMSGDVKVDLSTVDIENIQSKFKNKVQHDGEGIYMGDNPASPVVGDLRVTVEKIEPQMVSIIAEQTGDTLQPYMAPSGEAIALLVMGQVSSQQMIHDAIVSNEAMTWLLRAGTLLFMIIGVGLLLRPLVIIADVLPLLGSVVGFGVGFAAFVVGLFLWGVGTGIAWFFMRPLWAIGLIIIISALCYGLVRRRKTSL